LTTEQKDNNKVLTYIDPFVFGSTFWQTLFTNWWYNIGRDLFNNPYEVSKYWYEFNIESIERFNNMFNTVNNKVNNLV
jgi:hypothetical protein